MNRKANLKRHNHDSQYIKDLHFTKCRACGSKDLVKFEVDTFCTDCDWNSVLMDVACGNFEKRIAIVNRQRRQSQDPIEQPQISDEEVIQEIGA